MTVTYTVSLLVLVSAMAKTIACDSVHCVTCFQIGYLGPHWGNTFEYSP